MRTKIFFLFAMFASVMVSAQVTNVEPTGANYANKTVSFRVWWNAGSRDATHLSKVWVWIDYITVNSDNTTSGNTWTRATVGTISPTTGISYDGSNRQGFWLEGNSGSYSATIIVQLNITETKFNWCAYVSDYPPNVTAANGTYTFKGTPPFTLIATNGTTSQTVTGNTLAASALTITPTTIRDKTECPGIFCIYTGSDLYIDATHLCQQRTSGAKNWEAWIKDTRDNELYRIVLMPDNKWWLAQNVKYATTGSQQPTWCTKDECGRLYPPSQVNANWGGTYGTGSNKQGICPNGWVLPIRSEWENMTSKISGTTAVICRRLQAINCPCANGDDYYGWAALKVATYATISENAVFEIWAINDGTIWSEWINDKSGGSSNECGYAFYLTAANGNIAVRCLRQL
jgi:uncharacterized protein (TIGR02145 family)